MDYREFEFDVGSGSSASTVTFRMALSWDGSLPIVNGEGQSYPLNIETEWDDETNHDVLDVNVINHPDVSIENPMVLTGYVQTDYEYNKCVVLIAYARPLQVGDETICYEGGPRIHFTGTDDWNNNHYDYIDEDMESYRLQIPIHCKIEHGHDGTYTIDANFPIFDTQAHRNAYVISGDLTGCMNGFQEFDEDTKDYYIYTSHKSAIAKNGSLSWASGVATFTFERILAKKGSIALYKSAEPNVYYLKSGLVTGSYYSSTSQPAVENADTADFDDYLHYSGPFYDTYKSSYGDGTFELALPTRDLHAKSTTNIPIFSTEEDAEGYLQGTVPEEDAENYSYIANDFGDAENVTGDLEETTTPGVNNSRGVFAVDYCMARSGLASLGGDFFSDTYLEDMKKGLELYGNNPMNAVLGCMYFPFDISSIYSMTGVNYVAFGSYNHPVSGYGINKVLFNTGLKSLGSTYIRPTYKNFLDYTATEIYCFLPYVGWVNLDVNKYMDTTLEIKYSIDIHSGECCAQLYSNGRLMDSYDGQIGIKQPITSQDLSAYFQAQITGIKGAFGAVSGGAVNGAMAGAKGGAYGAIAGGVVGGGLGAIDAGATLYGLAKMRPTLFSSGGYSGALGCNLPQYAILVFCFHDVEEPANLLATHGKPSNKSGRISDFSGFLSVNSVNLQCGTATQEEKEEIMSYLANGVII